MNPEVTHCGSTPFHFTALMQLKKGTSANNIRYFWIQNYGSSLFWSLSKHDGGHCTGPLSPHLEILPNRVMYENFQKKKFSLYISYFHMKTAPPMNAFDFSSKYLIFSYENSAIYERFWFFPSKLSCKSSHLHVKRSKKSIF